MIAKKVLFEVAHDDAIDAAVESVMMLRSNRASSDAVSRRSI
jgi:hypothetical protein